MSAGLARAWSKRGWVACLLWPLSLVYGVLTRLHRGLYRTGVLRTECSPVPVVVVGNVVAGGAGKTPLVIALVQHFKQQGLQVGVVSRGYGRQGSHCLEVLENTPISESGDEPALILRAQTATSLIAGFAPVPSYTKAPLISKSSIFVSSIHTVTACQLHKQA